MSIAQARPGVSLRWWEPRPATGDLRAYVVAVLVVAASLAFRWMFHTWLAGNVPYLQFFPAIMVAAWYGGLGP
jgi:hypothetical protein